MRVIYTLLGRIAVPLAFARVLWRSIRDPAYRHGWAERFGFGAHLPGSGCIWVHAVSMGEVAAAASLVRALRMRFPSLPLVLTTATPTGAARARELFAGSVDVRFGPYDLPGSVRRLLARIRPKIAIFMETELWPNIYHECHRRDVPIMIANARISARSWPRYRRLRALMVPMLREGVTVAAQTSVDAERFRNLGASVSRTHVIGNLKFDIEIDPAVLERAAALRLAGFNARAIWVAGSTHAGEEDMVLDAHVLVRAAVPNAILILVPRHPHRFDTVAAVLKGRGLRFARRSDTQQIAPDIDVLLVDSLGELLIFYALCRVAFVGGSLVPIGGHNLLEPAALAIPVITGPFNSNSPDVARMLIERRAAACVRNALELAAAVARWLAQEEEGKRCGLLARSIVDENRGALRRLMSLIEPAMTQAL